jgi:predicted DNA-binding protein (MmcQ/YjbR family)
LSTTRRWSWRASPTSRRSSEATAATAARFYLPPYVGPKGWVALRLDLGEVDWNEVAELVLDSYRLVAPRRLAALADHGDPTA